MKQWTIIKWFSVLPALMLVTACGGGRNDAAPSPMTQSAISYPVQKAMKNAAKAMKTQRLQARLQILDPLGGMPQVWAASVQHTLTLRSVTTTENDEKVEVLSITANLSASGSDNYYSQILPDRSMDYYVSDEDKFDGIYYSVRAPFIFPESVHIGDTGSLPNIYCYKKDSDELPARRVAYYTYSYIATARPDGLLNFQVIEKVYAMPETFDNQSDDPVGDTTNPPGKLIRTMWSSYGVTVDGKLYILGITVDKDITVELPTKDLAPTKVLINTW